MNSNQTLTLVNQFAPTYDNYISDCSWHGPDMLFGLMHEYLSPGERILDLGIGTGLSAIPFKKAGLEIFGLDGSESMLEICSTKGITKELKQVDISKGGIPFNLKFHHIISFAVFHFLENLEILFREISNSVLEKGTFSFSIELYKPGNSEEYIESTVNGIYQKTQPDSGLIIYKHTEEYIFNALEISGFKVLKSTEILAFKDPITKREVYFALFVAKKEA